MPHPAGIAADQHPVGTERQDSVQVTSQVDRPVPAGSADGAIPRWLNGAQPRTVGELAADIGGSGSASGCRRNTRRPGWSSPRRLSHHVSPADESTAAKCRRHSSRAPSPSAAALTARTTTASHSTFPLPWSGSKPVSRSIQSLS